jgi:sec-independent protein translocase protein TatA
MPGSIGPLELVIVLILALIVLGPKRLPAVARSIGSGLRELRDSLNGSSNKVEAEQIASGEGTDSNAHQPRNP